MKGRNLTWFLLALWAIIYLWSIGALWLTAPTGDSFTRGLNRVGAFFGWQLLAAFIALPIWRAGRAFAPRTPARWLTRVPVALAGLLLVFCIGIVVYATLSRPDPDTPAHRPPVTETAPEVAPPME